MVEPKATACSILDLAIISDVLGQAWQFRHTAMSSSVSPVPPYLANPAMCGHFIDTSGKPRTLLNGDHVPKMIAEHLVVLAGFGAMPEFQR